MAIRAKAVGVRGKGLLWDLETRFGRRDGGSDDRGYYDSPYKQIFHLNIIQNSSIAESHPNFISSVPKF